MTAAGVALPSFETEEANEEFPAWTRVNVSGESKDIESVVVKPGERMLSGSVVVVDAGVAALAVSVTEATGLKVAAAAPGVDEPAVTVVALHEYFGRFTPEPCTQAIPPGMLVAVGPG